MPVITLIDKELLEKVPARLACHYKIMPISLDKGLLTLAVPDPCDTKILDDLRLLLECEVTGVSAEESDIDESIRKYYGIGAGDIEETGDISEARLLKTRTEDIDNVKEDASIIRFVNQILAQAVRDKATDIHIEPYEDDLKVRYRIDGLLFDVPVPKNLKSFQSAIVSRLKIMANLDISEKRLPHDGRIKIRMSGEELDIRISVLPTHFGESIDIRLLSGNILYGLEGLGLLPGDHEILESLIRRPHGIIFVTGPTGSGKTTTLYSCLSKINKTDRKIITIEDPVEYQLKGITQIQVNPRIGLTFGLGLRSMLRHDPDIMMVGEARDFETVKTTIRVALTGHLVFSTLHTNDSAGGITRLSDMGVEPYLIASSVECFIAQRLVRLICPKCKVKKRLRKDIFKDEFGQKAAGRDLSVYEGKGCEYCKFSGYRGRTGIYEFLLIDEGIRELILRGSSGSRIKKKALASGMHTLRMDGWEKVKKGMTTVSEIIRVTEKD
ncbi:MAG TPA: type II/IV secretion system protein [Candidatus Omnitrophica bacterium]|nr:type II/IV secretion system protein [Candidatus Omnitrophota bacterium]